jgi:hypothetical protein
VELGEYYKAKRAYGQALELDPYNAIAQRNLHRLSLLGERPPEAENDSHVEPQHFIEETGKAGLVNLYHLASREILARMVAGDKVYFKISHSNLTVEDISGQYLGTVELKHGQRLIRLIRGGNEYSGAIVRLTEGTLSVIVREEYQHPSQAGQHSFPPRSLGDPQPYISDRMLRRGLELEEAKVEEPGYTIIGGEGTEVIPAESIEVEEQEE